MNLFDVLILTILGFGLTRGILRGLISELSSIVGVILGFWAAYTYYVSCAAKFEMYTKNQSFANILGFLFIFSSVTLVIGISTLSIKYLVNINQISWINRILGGVFGLLKTILVVGILLLVLTTFLPYNTTFVKKSQLSSYIIQISETIVRVTTQDMKFSFFPKTTELKFRWGNHSYNSL